MNAEKLDNVSDIIKFLKKEVNKEYVTHPGVKMHINKYFWEVQIGDLDQSWTMNYDTLLGTKSLHQVKLVSHRNPTLFQIWDLSCFCVVCVDRCSEEQCDFRSHVTPLSL